jgi:leader peptidase (prepilin peptidase) / N-methyltransferase
MMADALVLALVGAAMLLAALAARRDLAVPLGLGLPLLLAAVSALGGAFAALGAPWSHAAIIAALIANCALIAEIDRRAHLIADPLVLAIAMLALAAPFGDGLAAQTLGALLLGALFYAVRRGFAAAGKPEALGLGDVKLAAAMGAFVGPSHALLAVAIAGAATIAVVALPSARVGAPHGLVAAGAPFGVGLAAALAAVAALRLWGIA